jgi:hypothetical protein
VNWRSVTAFATPRGLPRAHGDRSGATGLDYAGVEALRRLRGTPIDPDTFAGLQICEGAALAVINERRER